MIVLYIPNRPPARAVETYRPPPRTVAIWLALLVLLIAAVGLAVYGPSILAPPATLVGALAMAFLVLAVFRELERGAPLFWVLAGVGFFWLLILLGLTAVDYLSQVPMGPA